VFEMVCVEDHLQHAAAHFARNWWFTWLENAFPHGVGEFQIQKSPTISCIFSTGEVCRNLSCQTSRRFTVSVVNPVQPSVLKQSLAGPRIGLLSPLDHHPGYTIDEGGHQRGYQAW